MKHYILFIVAILSCLTGFAQGGYDPENPGDPNPYRKLSVLASPKAGGAVGTENDSRQVGVGQTVYCYADENQYYEFVHWLKNGDIVSTEPRFSFAMPDEDVEMIAVFELNYNPQSPDDPQETKPSHRVTLTASPGKGGHFNNSVFKLYEGDSTNIYAYPNEGYRFEEWLLDGVLVSTKNPLRIKMTDKNLHYTAKFSYNPINPSDPAVNLFNPATGEMIVDQFEKGYLSSAISVLLNDDYDYSAIQSLLVSGVMDGSDFGMMSRLINCSVIDFSRTNGYNEIPSYAFESMTTLTDLSLPACINSIGRYAFQGCNNLSVINCYAVIPPTLDYGVFDGVDNSVVIKVPAQSIDLYKNAGGWKNFTILSANDNVFSISVTLPSDAKDGRYKNMSIELLNTSNGQRYKYLITDKTEYVFGNLLSDTKYSVFVKNSKDEILGEITDLEIIDKNLSASFQSLLQPLNISLQVLTPDGENIAGDVIVKWFNESNELMHQGSLLTGVLENTVVSYTISLPQQLQTVYSQPSPKILTISESNSLICTLEALGKSILKGRIIDKEDQPISAAIITVSQNINGTYINSENVLCDNDGNFSTEIPNVPIKITVSANGYISQTKELQSAPAGIGEIVLEKNVGITIFPSYTFQESTSVGDTKPETDWYSNDANIAYRISDINGNEISNCIYQAGSIILPQTIGLEDNVIVTAFSKDNKFKDVSQSLYLTSKSVYVKLPIVEYGGISVKTTYTEAASSTCILYDVTERQVGKAALRNNGIFFTHLPDGEYSLITMNKSSLLGSIQNLSSLRETPLEEGKDFIINKVNVISGRISDITIANVPDLDETKLYYTNSNETYFMPNKSQLTIGNYVTLKAKLTIKDEYAEDIDAATLIVDIPSNCEFVENSIISGSGYLGYEYTNNRLSIPIQNLSDAVRFCIVPLEGGNCKPSAFVKLIIDNEEILQPIGSAYFEAKNFSLAAPQKTSKTNIAIRGTATSYSEVLIYDNETLVGSTYSMPNGQWSVRLSLHKPYSKSIHNLYGEVITKDGKQLLTQTKIVDYDQSYVDLSKVTMVYNNTNIIFDHLNGKNTANSYSYVPGTTDFTFIADFTENNPEKISNVVIKILASDGNVRSIPAEYNSTLGNWVVRTKYADSNKLPINATADFLVQQNIFDNSESFEEQTQLLADCANEINNYVQNNWNYTIVEESQDRIVMDIDENNSEHYSVAITHIDFNEACNLMNNVQFDFSKNENGYYLCSHTEIIDGHISVIFVDLEDSLAYEVTFVFNNSNPMFTRGITGSILSGFSWAGDKLGGLLSTAIPYITIKSDLDYMYNITKKYNWDLDELCKNTEDYLKVRCSDGSLKLSEGEIAEFYKELSFLKEQEGNFIDNMYEYISEYKRKVEYSIAYDIALTALGGKGASLIANSLKFMPYSKFISSSTKFFTSGTTTTQISNILTNTLGVVLGGIIDGIDNIFNPAFADFQGTYEEFSSWTPKQLSNYINKHIQLQNDIKLNYKECKEEDDDKNDDGGDDETNDFPAPPITPSIDPSGYVYEAVPSNRIPGVTATAYYKQQEEDMYGDITETAVVWDATPFGQENPLTTDNQGKYAWDVPAGMWQVRFDKEGYEPAQSAWLPVPPPQLDVNISMTQAKQPEIKTVHAYSDGVTIEFDKFMLPSTLSLGNVAITQNGNIVNGNIETSNMELDANGNAFCSKIEFRPESPLTEGEATLFVSKAVKSYANINMSADFMQTFNVEPRVSEIKVDKNIEVCSGSTTTISAYVVPASAAESKTVLIESLNPMIASVSTERVETDANGLVSFDVSGLIHGSTSIKLSIEDYDIEAVIYVNVVTSRDENQVAAPYASIKSGEVKAGTEIYLYCETKNASIYYTVDGSCPCDINRQKYDGTPIIVDKDLTLKIISEANGMIESDIVEYQYTVNMTGIGEIQIDKDLSIYPLPLGEYLNIANGDKSIDSVYIFDINGKLMLHSGKSEKQVSLNVGFLTPGIYILNVKTNGQSIINKIIKR